MGKEHPSGEPRDVGAPEAGGFNDDALSNGLAILTAAGNYNHWIYSAIRRFLGPAVLEVGAGIGSTTQFLLNSEQLVCLEPVAGYHRYLVDRFAGHRNVKVLRQAVEACPNDDVPGGHFDAIICLNVLEHIEDEAAALRTFRELLKPGGRAIVLVPALPWIYGEMDRQVGHFRRYTLRSLRRGLVEAGMKPVYGRYFNMVGALGWWWMGCVRKRKSITASSTMLFDRLVPFLSAVERLIPPLWGQSAIVVGRA